MAKLNFWQLNLPDSEPDLPDIPYGARPRHTDRVFLMFDEWELKGCSMPFTFTYVPSVIIHIKPSDLISAIYEKDTKDENL